MKQPRPDPNCRWCHGSGIVRDVIDVNTGGVHAFRGNCHCLRGTADVLAARYEEAKRLERNRKLLNKKIGL